MKFSQAEAQLKAAILPILRQLDNEISKIRPEIRPRVLEGDGGDLSQYRNYNFTLDCQVSDTYKDKAVEDKHEIVLVIELKQRHPDVPPRLNAFVMDTINDEESIVKNEAFQENMPASQDTIKALVDRLPDLYRTFKNTLAEL